MKNTLIRTVIFAAWLTCMAWLIRYEAYPEFFTHQIAGYKHMLSRDVLVMDSWMRILFKGQPIGYSHSNLEINDESATEHYVMNSRVQLRLKLMGEEQNISVDATAGLDLLYTLQKFTFSMTSRGYSMEVSGIRRSGKKFKVVIATRDSRQTLDIEVPDDVVIYSPMTEMAMKALKPGQSLSIKTLDPASFTTATVIMKALRHEPLDVGGFHYAQATVLSTQYQGMEVLSWMDPSSGEMIRQETPFGWNFEKCTPEQAMEALSKASSGSGDLLTSMAVPCNKPIPNARTIHVLRLRLTDVAFTENELESPRQHVERINGNTTDLRLTGLDLPADDLQVDISATNLAPFLAATPSLQSDNDEIRRRAVEITAGCATPLRKALAISNWAHDKIEKEMTVSLPSALDVLRTMKGDCNEHAYLCVALARAVGIPAKVKVGVAYHEGAFYYHAWPAMYVGQWLETDPTWGQDAVDPTHLALVEGELQQQFALARIIGRLKIQVIEGDTP